MSLIGSVSSYFQPPLAGNVEFAGKMAPLEMPGVAGAAPVQAAPQTASSFGAILDGVVGEVNSKMAAGSAEQAKVLSGESTNLHQAMISMQEAAVAFSLMVEVRNKLVESYQELMRMQV